MRMDTCPVCVAETKPRGNYSKCVRCGFEFHFDDMLRDIVRRNKLFTDYVRNKNPTNVNIGESLSWLVFNALALGAEWGELAQEIPWKWWKEGKIEKEKIAGELIDMFHFVLVIFDEIGYTSEDIWQAYIAKNEENWKRFRKRWGNEKS